MNHVKSFKLFEQNRAETHWRVTSAFDSLGINDYSYFSDDNKDEFTFTVTVDGIEREGTITWIPADTYEIEYGNNKFYTKDVESDLWHIKNGNISYE